VPRFTQSIRAVTPNLTGTHYVRNADIIEKGQSYLDKVLDSKIEILP